MARQKYEISVDVNASNWLDLADHFKDKVLKRTSELTYLHTRAGFLIAGAVITVQIIVSLPKFDDAIQIVGLLLAAITAVASLIMAIVSMHKAKSSTPLNPDEMILAMTEQPLTRETFGNWLAKSYAASNKAFNDEYSTKYNQQIISGGLLVLSLVITLILKGTKLYV